MVSPVGSRWPRASSPRPVENGRIPGTPGQGAGSTKAGRADIISAAKETSHGFRRSYSADLRFGRKWDQSEVEVPCGGVTMRIAALAFAAILALTGAAQAQ